MIHRRRERNAETSLPHLLMRGYVVSSEFPNARAFALTQTLAELLDANQGYLNWLDSIGAEQTKQDFVLSLEKSAMPRARAYAAYVAPLLQPPSLIQIGGVSLSPYTHRSMNIGFDADPLNLLFVGEARAERVADIFLRDLFPPDLWYSTVIPPGFNCAETRWVYFESSAASNWQGMSYTIAIAGCSLKPRCHIRLFDGDCDEQLGNFTLASVHYEHWDWLKRNHVIEDWDRSQDFVKRLFKATPFCERTYTERFQEDEEIQNVHHDGLATVVELQ